MLRPGEPPTLEIATQIFNNLFFSSDRYDLSDVGRVKMNSRLNLDCSDKITILRNDDIISIVKKMLDLRDGKDEVDDIDHLGNRRVRSVGELVENQARIGVYRMERAIKEKMTTLDVESAMPQGRQGWPPPGPGGRGVAGGRYRAWPSPSGGGWLQGRPPGRSGRHGRRRWTRPRRSGVGNW